VIVIPLCSLNPESSSPCPPVLFPVLMAKPYPEHGVG
jgi:hypothetical protein